MIYERNRQFAAEFDGGDLAIRPKLATIVLTCVDARVDPAHFAGLELGDALVLRTVGGRVTDAVMTEVSVLWHLMKAGSGTAPQLGLAIIHHSDCGMERFAAPPVAEAMTTALGAEVVATYAIANADSALVEDVERALDSDRCPPDLSVSAHYYDVTTGALRQVIPPPGEAPRVEP